MSLLDGIRYRLGTLRRGLFDRAAYRRDLDDELRMHLELEAMHQTHAGASREDAARAARARFGNPARVRERLVDRTGVSAIDALGQDVRFAIRSLITRPAFTAVAVLTLAIGIGANSAIFSAVDALLLRPLPYREPDRLMTLAVTIPPSGARPAIDNVPWSYPKFAVVREAQRVFSDVALWFPSEFTVRVGDEAIRTSGEAVDANYIAMLGATPVSGRAFAPSTEGVVGGPNVVVIGTALWERAFNADPAVLGRTMEVDGTTYTVIGVMPRSFGGLSGQSTFWIPIVSMPQVWSIPNTRPDGSQTTWLSDPYNHSTRAIGRLAPSVSPERATAMMRELGARVDATYPDRQFASTHWGAAAQPLDQSRADERVRRTLFILLGAVGLVLLIGCVNVANLLLVRASGRRREIALRIALGAGRGRLVRQLLTESVILSTLGGAASLLVAWCGTSALTRLHPGALMRLQNIGGVGAVDASAIRLDVRALAMTGVLALTTGVLFGLLPALQSTSTSVTSTLKDDGPLRIGGSRVLTSRNLLTIAEIAFAVVLLAGSSLTLRSLAQLLGVAPGFVASNVMTMRVNRAPAWARDSISRFYDVALERLGRVPGVSDVAMSDCAPLVGCVEGTPIKLLDRPAPPGGTEPGVGVHWITTTWPRVVRMPLVRGRLFTADDRIDTRKVVLVSEAAVRRFWPNSDPIGQPVALSIPHFEHDTAYVVGVVGDVRFESLEQAPLPEVYVSYHQSPIWNRMMFFFRTTGDPASVTNPARLALREVAPGFPVYAARTLEDLASDASAYARVSASLLALFAGVALLLATIGVYGVISFAVAQRSREIAVRTALGATRGNVVRMVVGHGIALAAVGTFAGMVGALGATRVLRSLLYDVAPTDPISYGAIVVVLTVAVAAACWLPARRATRVPATQLLRSS